MGDRAVEDLRKRAQWYREHEDPWRENEAWARTEATQRALELLR